MSRESQAPAEHGTDLGLERLIFFSDAVFAIVITLLALDIRLPVVAEHLNDAGVLNGLIAIIPKFLACFLSFFIIGSYWAGHHRQFNLIKRYNRLLLWLNLLLLSFICLVPFATSLISEHGNTAGTIFYAAVMAIVGFIAASMWFYAASHGRLLDHAIEPARWRRLLVRVLIAPAVFLLSIPVAFIDNDLAKYSWAIIGVVLFIRV
jgi:uncharacterized membrane protein